MSCTFGPTRDRKDARGLGLAILREFASKLGAREAAHGASHYDGAPTQS